MMRYLTLQDMIWINLQVVKKVVPFHVLNLEEATFYQYGYGGSQDVRKQADAFLQGFSSKAPFTEGNDRTALIGALAFMRLNGETGDSGEEWWDEARAGTASLTTFPVRGDSGHHGEESPEQAIEAVLARLG